MGRNTSLSTNEFLKRVLFEFYELLKKRINVRIDRLKVDLDDTKKLSVMDPFKTTRKSWVGDMTQVQRVKASELSNEKFLSDGPSTLNRNEP